MTLVADCWLFDNKSTVLAIFLVDFDTLVKVDLSGLNFVLDALAVGNTTDSFKR